MADTININGTDYRVVYNMRALFSFVKARGTDEVPTALSFEDKLLLMICCFSEGCRKEEKEFDTDALLELSPAEFGRVSAEFDVIFSEQSRPMTGNDSKKKVTESQ